MVFAPASSSKEVEQRDPALSVLRPSEWRHRVEEFLTGPIRRYADGVLEVTMNKSLDSRATTVPGSYTINHSATVRFADRPATSSWATPSATKSQDSPRACQHSVETSFPTGPTPRTPTCSAYSSEPSQPPNEDGGQSGMSSSPPDKELLRHRTRHRPLDLVRDLSPDRREPVLQKSPASDVCTGLPMKTGPDPSLLGRSSRDGRLAPSRAIHRRNRTLGCTARFPAAARTAD